ncbi:MAG: acetyl-CoA carboxylase, biotin carboxyl carrier protein [Nitrospirae bacterium CG18_big_fil_WC_8_21_14_2_50_70_55]|nr:acetyl-CoA carboxylase biotin carboxyl carrier protein [Deltaproteobacteria bacterium]PIQ06204.1 MAG: acetyl-CoA carboxylase, biotin carboxyl carrier protein [Nitrospirae bacterium CG18_big_fil_WC_8_21_14_2_50_70_55]PIU80242.1 MAG: acetyl-CoA carboxylase, biotin carboxyl carrier protein [Nitrospirae bacterium CG06_land_8_20_14_3_00_70_43]PIW83127.1 MAG: acetyl-CoA carboxylase, biotin carboxyl carrier protein [Nitrospirae bacterium CG_4_8_14_3_um_filter_70_85]PIX83984.1 MAG: acetyl-CoA carbox
MTNKDIRDLIRILSRTDVEELEVERSGTRVRLRRFGRTPPAVAAQGAVPAVAAPVAAVVANAPAAAPPAAEGGLQKGQEVITSPIVGTFYRAPAPDAPPYVAEGDQVKAGQTLCVIEAMKLMNEVEAEKGCRIVKVLLEDATPVEFGEPLFVIET